MQNILKRNGPNKSSKVAISPVPPSSVADSSSNISNHSATNSIESKSQNEVNNAILPPSYVVLNNVTELLPHQQLHLKNENFAKGISDSKSFSLEEHLHGSLMLPSRSAPINATSNNYHNNYPPNISSTIPYMPASYPPVGYKRSHEHVQHQEYSENRLQNNRPQTSNFPHNTEPTKYHTENFDYNYYYDVNNNNHNKHNSSMSRVTSVDNSAYFGNSNNNHNPYVYTNETYQTHDVHQQPLSSHDSSNSNKNSSNNIPHIYSMLSHSSSLPVTNTNGGTIIDDDTNFPFPPSQQDNYEDGHF